jgi:membrane protease subunit HflK
MSNQSPWGGNNNQNPPDLDEAINELKQKLGGLFGGGKNNGSGGNNNENATIIGDNMPQMGGKLKYIIILILIVWALSGVYIVDPAERGVVTRFGAITHETKEGPHWHLPYPIEKVEIVNVSQIRTAEIGFREMLNSSGAKFSRKVPTESLMLTKDGNIVDAAFEVQYNITNATKYLFNVLDPEKTLEQITNSAIREVVGKHKMDYIITEGRAEVAQEVKEKSQELLDSYSVGLNIVNVNFKSAQAPDQVQAAYSDVTKAKTDKERYINQAQAYANDILPKARGQSARLIEEANAYKSQIIAKSEGESHRFLQILGEYEKAPKVTKERLYRETMEEVLANTSKVVVGSGNNSMMYLPLDKLTNQKQEIQTNTNTQIGVQDTNTNQRTNLRNLRTREVK